MSDESTIDEQSHYEISLTAGQAFMAFVLLLLSLAASFAFGLMIGRGQGDDRLVVKKEPSVVTEASAVPKKSGKIVELGVADDDFKNKTQTDTASTAAPLLTEGSDGVSTETAAAAAAKSDPSGAVPASEVTPAPAAAKPAIPAVAPAAAKTPLQKSDVQAAAAAKPAGSEVAHAAKGAPVYAQLLSTADQKTAESLAAKVINAGFTSSYVDRATNEKGPVYRVRVRFSSEADARAAEARLREFARDVWIVK